MANIVSNILTINGAEDQVAKVRDYIKGSNGESISFQSIFPMPERLKGKHMVKVRGENLPWAKNLTIPDWMAWRLKWWGSQGDAESIHDDAVDAPNRIIFNTPNTTPDKVIMILSAIFPAVSFHVIFSDQEVGSYCGEYTFSGGEVTNMVWYDRWESNPSDISVDQQMEYYFRTHEYAREEWKKGEDGKWRRIHDEEEE